jgi:hypothetical protein
MAQALPGVAHWMRRDETERLCRTLAPVIAVAVLAVGASILIATPTLNYDDLLYAIHVPTGIPDYLAGQGFWAAVQTMALNSDSPGEIRTYGLTRIAESLKIGVIGTRPWTTYATITTIHFASSILVYRIVAPIDRITAYFSAVAWAGSPAVLPVVGAETHLFYLMGPYYALLGWICYEREAARSVTSALWGALLLTATWWLGESVVIATAGVVMYSAARRWAAGNRRGALLILAQGAMAATVLAAYLAYQLAVIHIAAKGRFTISIPAVWPEAATRVARFFDVVWQTARGVMGLRFWNYELGMSVAGFSSFNSPLTWLLAAGLALAFICAARGVAEEAAILPLRRNRAALLMIAAVGSLGVYFTVALITTGAIAPRYIFSFLALMPPAIIAVITAFCGIRPGRYLGAIVTAMLLAAFLSSFVRAEQLVSKPNRALLSTTRQTRIPVVLTTELEGGYPVGWSRGLRPRLLLPDPMASGWTAEAAFKLYADGLIDLRPLEP